jgi:hypothetical protein
LDKHQDNIMASLNHRLAIARAANNTQLIALLEQERQQVSGKQTHPGTALWQKILAFVLGDSRLQVSQFFNGSDRWWYAFNPQTGECVYADSEAELRLWIKENYQGR